MNPASMHSLRSRRGSVLVVALLFAAIIAISLTSYLKLATSALTLANRSFYSNGAMNMSDLGIEQALWCLNNKDWTRFTDLGGDRYHAIFPTSTTYYTFSGGVKGQVRVWVDAPTSVGTPPVVTRHTVSQATITLGDGTTLVKMAESYLQQRTYNDEPMVARTGLSFNGNVSIDSWDSHSDTTTTADDVLYSIGSRHAEAGIASASVTVNSTSLQNADIYGRAAVGTSDTSGISVGSGGRLAGSFSAGTGIDYSRVTTNFTTSFPDIEPATGNVNGPLAAIDDAISFPVDPVNDDTTVDPNDGKTYYIYSVPSITLSGNSKTLTVAAGYNVKINVTGTSGTTVQTTGQGEINVNPGGSLKLYVAADVNIAGNGVLNGASSSSAPSNPANFQLCGTRTEVQAATLGMQSINIKGNGYLSAVVNAPNANVFVNGNADTFGAVFANHVTIVGNGSFHADESLSRMRTSGLWGVIKWRELSNAADRATYATQMTF